MFLVNVGSQAGRRALIGANQRSLAAHGRTLSVSSANSCECPEIIRDCHRHDGGVTFFEELTRFRQALKDSKRHQGLFCIEDPLPLPSSLDIFVGKGLHSSPPYPPGEEHVRLRLQEDPSLRVSDGSDDLPGGATVPCDDDDRSEILWSPVVAGNLIRQQHPAFCTIASAQTVMSSIMKDSHGDVFASPELLQSQLDFFGPLSSVSPQFKAFPTHFFKAYGFSFLDALPDFSLAFANMTWKQMLIRRLMYDGTPVNALYEFFNAPVVRDELGIKDLEYISAGSLDSVEQLEQLFGDSFSSCDSGTNSSNASAEGQDGGSSETHHDHGRTYIIASYSRTVVGQTRFSGGHVAPIGAFDPVTRKVLIWEVNSWRYPSIWVDSSTFLDALRTQTGVGMWRGLLKIRA